MKKITSYITDIAVTVGCSLGVGFLSGKEAQIYFGNIKNVLIFAVFFAAVNILFREYCRRKRCDSVKKLSCSLLKKGSAVLDTLISLCCFVCIVTMLAGAQECLNKIFPLSNLPFYGFVCAIAAAVALKNGEKALKIANVISVTLAIVLVIIMLCVTAPTVKATDITAEMPIVYALFSITMSFGVTSKLACESDVKRNVICPVISAVALSLFMLSIMTASDFNTELPAIDALDGAIINAFAVITLILAAVTGIVACAYPIVDQLYPLIPDNPLCCATIFGAALAFAMFGFDFAVRVGYVLVGIIGLLTLTVSAIQLFSAKKQSL